MEEEREKPQKYPRLVNAMQIMAEPETLLRVSINLYRQRLYLKKVHVQRGWYNARVWHVSNNNRAVVINNMSRDINRIISVEDYIEKVQRILDTIGRKRLANPKMFISNTVKGEDPIVVDMSRKDDLTGRKWGATLGWVDSEDEASLRRSGLQSKKDMPYPFKNLYLCYGGVGTPYAFVYPMLKNFIAEILADPYAFKEQESMTIKIPNLHNCEERFLIDKKHKTVQPISHSAEHRAAAKEVKKL